MQAGVEAAALEFTDVGDWYVEAGGDREKGRRERRGERRYIGMYVASRYCWRDVSSSDLRVCTSMTWQS